MRVESKRYRDIFEDMVVDVPEGKSGNVTIERFEVTGRSIQDLRYELDGRGCKPGIYTMLKRNGQVWMSDTTAERRDHAYAALAIRSHGGRVLIGGLGLGMILKVALLADNVTHVDVVELDQDVIRLVEGHYRKMAEENGKTLTIHQDDVYRIKWPPNTKWEVAYFDVWADLCTDNLEEMSKLRRSYGRRAKWCDCWGRDILLSIRDRERNQGWW